jgi:hypothetical protein
MSTARPDVFAAADGALPPAFVEEAGRIFADRFHLAAAIRLQHGRSESHHPRSFARRGGLRSLDRRSGGARPALRRP